MWLAAFWTVQWQFRLDLDHGDLTPPSMRLSTEQVRTMEQTARLPAVTNNLTASDSNRQFIFPQGTRI